MDDEDMDLPSPNVQSSSMYLQKLEEENSVISPFRPTNIAISPMKKSEIPFDSSATPDELRYDTGMKSRIQDSNKFFDSLKSPPSSLEQKKMGTSIVESIFSKKKKKVQRPKPGKKRTKLSPSDVIFCRLLDGKEKNEIPKSLLVADILSSPASYESSTTEKKKKKKRTIHPDQVKKEKRELEELIRKRVNKKLELMENEKTKNIKHFKSRESVRKRCNNSLLGRSKQLTSKQAKKLKSFLHEKSTSNMESLITPPSRKKKHQQPSAHQSMKVGRGGNERKNIFNKSKSCQSFQFGRTKIVPAASASSVGAGGIKKKKKSPFERYFDHK